MALAVVIEFPLCSCIPIIFLVSTVVFNYSLIEFTVNLNNKMVTGLCEGNFILQIIFKCMPFECMSFSLFIKSAIVGWLQSL